MIVLDVWQVLLGLPRLGVSFDASRLCRSYISTHLGNVPTLAAWAAWLELTQRANCMAR